MFLQSSFVPSVSGFSNHQRARGVCRTAFAVARGNVARSHCRTAFLVCTAPFSSVPGSHLDAREAIRSRRAADEQVAETGSSGLRLPALGRAALSFAPALVTVQALEAAAIGSSKNELETQRSETCPAPPTWPRKSFSTSSFRYTFHALGSHEELYKKALQAEIGMKLLGSDTQGVAIVVRVDPSYVTWKRDVESTLSEPPSPQPARFGGRPMLADSHRQEKLQEQYARSESIFEDTTTEPRARVNRKHRAEASGTQSLKSNISSSFPDLQTLTSPFSAGGAIPIEEEERARHHRLFIDGKITDLPPRNASFHGPCAPECFAVRVLRGSCHGTLKRLAVAGECEERSMTADCSVEDYCIMCAAQSGMAQCRSFRACFGSHIESALNVLPCA
ncbi:hypothetical protein F1559_003656 [Cyanidiococcus yangmingshanensis]|uniref:Uncharacterized protein n=1 Tax=Cyanidiococcus yangmingshanensis TaxID=2690220 RepID=A0A7J7IIZ2_9RHOD|nr:hypothetical protein F1559_003656 [Cyanidiococcus yangmingshanensis]